MAFKKFEYLIEERAPYFARTDQFDDPLEGSFPNGSLIFF